MAADTVTTSVFIDAAPRDVFGYFASADEIVRWMGDRAVLDPRPGGEFSVDIRGVPVRGRFLELEPPNRLLISWGYANSEQLPAGASTVEITLTECNGGTVVHVEHAGLPASERGGHDIGWRHYLARLVVAATGGDPGDDPGMAQHASRGVRLGRRHT